MDVSVSIYALFCTDWTISLNPVVYIPDARIVWAMMRRNMKLAISILCLMALLSQAQAADIKELTTLVLGMDDPYMDSYDLAFFLVTHNFDAKPMNGYVQVDLNGMTYKLTPNAELPGLADITSLC